jgi:ferredoxin-NADP reductase
VGTEPGWPGFRPLRVAKLVPESSTVTSVYLSADDGTSLPKPRAGQYLTLRVAGAGDPAPVRSYSLSSSPDADIYRISVKREPHGIVSDYLNSRLTLGATVDVAAPRGEFVLTDDTGPLLLVSAGIGVTPVLAMLHRLAATNTDRDVWWIYTAHDSSQHAFAGEAHGLLQSLPTAHEQVFYTSPETDPPAGISVSRGRPTPAALAALGLPIDAAAYICGPAAFMDEMRTTLSGLGIADDHIHTELFGALAAINPGVTDVRHVSPHPPPRPDGTGPQITFARSSLIVRWADGDGTLLDLADACDVPTRFSCRSGVCHTCVTSLLAGRFAYSPAPLELPADGTVLICCAQPETDLVLDM